MVYKYDLVGGKITFQKDNQPNRHGLGASEFKRLSVDANRVYVVLSNETHIINPALDSVVLDGETIDAGSKTVYELFDQLNSSSVFQKASSTSGGGSTSASDLTSGKLADARLSDNVVLKDENGMIPSELIPTEMFEVDISGKVDKVEGKQLSTEDYTTAEKEKLAGLYNTDLSDVQSQINNKVDKDGIKVLSDNNYTTEEKTKLAGIEPFDDTELQTAIDSKVDKQTGYGLSETSFTQSEKNKLANISEKYFGRFTSESALQGIVGIPGAYAFVSLPSVPTEIFAWNAETNQWDNTALASGEETAESLKLKYESNPDTNSFTDIEKAKLAALIIDATKNQTDAYLLNRANHTGTQSQSTITGLVQRLTDMDNLIEAIIRIDDGQTLILESHRNQRDNPHQVTKAQVGLPRVDNTSDAEKEVSGPTQTALNGKSNFPTVNSSVPTRNNSGAQSSLPYSYAATGTTLALRNPEGTLNIATPTTNSHASTKEYTDAGDNTVIGETILSAAANIVSVALNDLASNVLRFEFHCPSTSVATDIKIVLNNDAATQASKTIVHNMAAGTYTMSNLTQVNGIRVTANVPAQFTHIRCAGTISNRAGEYKIAEGLTFISGSSAANTPHVATFFGSVSLTSIVNSKISNIRFQTLTGNFNAGTRLTIYKV